jgi:hypothetical protein
MVNEQQQDSGRRPANQGVRDVIPEPNKIDSSEKIVGGFRFGQFAK